MTFWKSASDAKAPVLKWTDQAVNEFFARFSEFEGAARFDVVAHLTHQVVERTSTNLSTREFAGTDTRLRYYGWLDLGGTVGEHKIRHAPLALVIRRSPKDTFRVTDLSAFSSCEPIGRGYLWKRGGDSEEEQHGLEVTLTLDTRRFRTFRHAIVTHRGTVAPRVTLALRRQSYTVAADLEHHRVVAGSPFDVVAYWTETWPLWHGDAANHPWASEHL